MLAQGFGVAEGRHKEYLKNMANAAGQSCRDYTPPGGETLDQVSPNSWPKEHYLYNSAMQWSFCRLSNPFCFQTDLL